MNQRCAYRRNGYTLLEVIIALGLLATLIAVLASMMALFSDAENKAQRTAQRLRALRAVRTLLANDLQQIRVLSDPKQSNQNNSSNDSPLGLDSLDNARPTDSTANGLDDAFGQGNDPLGFPSGSSLASRMNQTSTRDQSLGDSGIEFVGTSQGFECQVLLDEDPGRWLELLLVPPELDAMSTGVGLPTASSSATSSRGLSSSRPLLGSERSSTLASDGGLGSGAASTGGQNRWAETARLQWQLTPDPEFVGFGHQLTRRITPNWQTDLPAPTGRDPLDVLDASDLYRIEEPTANPTNSLEGLSPLEPPPMEAKVIRNAQFRYSDGVDWYRSWNASSRSGPPVAIELSFDMGEAWIAPTSRTGALLPNSTTTRSTDGLVDSPLNGIERPLDEAVDAETPDPELIRDTEYRLVFLVGNASDARARSKIDQTSAGRASMLRGLR